MQLKLYPPIFEQAKQALETGEAIREGITIKDIPEQTKGTVTK